MKKPNLNPSSNVVDDVARLAGGAIGMVSEIRQSVQSNFKERIEYTASNLDLVPRSDFERLEILVQNQHQEISALQKRLSELEKTK